MSYWSRPQPRWWAIFWGRSLRGGLGPLIPFLPYPLFALGPSRRLIASRTFGRDISHLFPDDATNGRVPAIFSNYQEAQKEGNPLRSLEAAFEEDWGLYMSHIMCCHMPCVKASVTGKSHAAGNVSGVSPALALAVPDAHREEKTKEQKLSRRDRAWEVKVCCHASFLMPLRYDSPRASHFA